MLTRFALVHMLVSCMVLFTSTTSSERRTACDRAMYSIRVGAKHGSMALCRQKSEGRSASPRKVKKKSPLGSRTGVLGPASFLSLLSHLLIASFPSTVRGKRGCARLPSSFCVEAARRPLGLGGRKVVTSRGEVLVSICQVLPLQQ
jgi:hypothetical protein